MEKMERVAIGWKENANSDEFAEMTAQQFDAEIEKSREVRRQIESLETQLDDLNSRIDIIDKANMALKELVVNAVRGSRKHGSDSPLIGSMGYVRKSERRTGKTNRPKTEN